MMDDEEITDGEDIDRGVPGGELGGEKGISVVAEQCLTSLTVYLLHIYRNVGLGANTHPKNVKDLHIWR